jgi:hypothetical protein
VRVARAKRRGFAPPLSSNEANMKASMISAHGTHLALDDVLRREAAI